MNIKKAKDIMTTEVIVAKKGDSVIEIAKLLLNKHIGGLPVVDEKNRVIGIISETDIIKKEKHIKSPAFITFLQGIIMLDDYKEIEEDIKDIAAYKIEDLMSTEVVKVDEDESFDDVANIMIKQSVNRVPVIDKDNTLKGIICRYDIIKAMYNE